jgi:hypothetical protein
MYDHERSLVTKLAGKPFALVGVNTDEDLGEIRRIVKDKNLIWRSFFDGADNRISMQYKISIFPTVMILDHRGVIRAINPENLDATIDEIMAQIN